MTLLGPPKSSICVMETPPEPRWGCMKRRDMEQIIIPFFANWTKFKGLKGNNIHIDNLIVKKLRENPALCFTGSRISGARLSIISLLEIKRDPCLTCIVGVPPLSHLYHHLVETMQCWLSDLQSKALLPGHNAAAYDAWWLQWNDLHLRKCTKVHSKN